MAHLRVLADEFNLDLTRVVATGHSAGGHLALWVAAQNRIPPGSSLKRDQLVNFKAVVGFAAIPDLAYFARAGAHACGDNTIAQLIALDNAGHFELIAPWTLPGKAVVAKILEALKY